MKYDRVLVVDDDQAFLQLMVTHLQRREFTVLAARDGLDALRTLRTDGPFAVMVTDLSMPGMGGLELLREARKLDPSMEVIVVTGEKTLESAISAMREDGAYDYLPKPLEVIGELSMIVKRAADHRRLRLERESLQASLANEAERLRALIHNTGDAILSADGVGLLQVANPAAVRLLGQDGLTGQPAQVALPPQLLGLVANWQSMGGRQPAVVEVPWPDGSVQMANLMSLPAPRGQAGGWVLVLRDVTHFKRLDDLKLRLLADAAGKLRIPLAQALISLAELSSLLEAKGGRPAEIVYRLVKLWDRIQDWIEDLLAMVRLEAGGDLRATAVEPAALLTELVGAVKGELQASLNLELWLDDLPDLPAVWADPDLLRQTLRGLINRAAARSPAGSQIHVAARERQDQVWMEVRDAGPAVDEADLPHIFEKAPNGQGLSSEGTGLELAMTKAVIERLGGQVWMHGGERLGSTITVCLPAVAEGEGVA